MKYLIPIMLSLFVLAACSSGGGEMNAVTSQNIAGDSSTGISATDASTVDAPMDAEILTYTSKRDYGAERDELETGSPYWMIFTFTG